MINYNSKYNTQAAKGFLATIMAVHCSEINLDKSKENYLQKLSNTKTQRIDELVDEIFETANLEEKDILISKILKLRYGLVIGEAAYSLDECCKRYNLEKTRIRKLENDGINAIINSEKIKELAEKIFKEIE